jgi:hypothetical protein
MTLWRLNVKTSAKDGFDPRRFCLEKNLAGAGWGVEHENGHSPNDFDHYLKLGQAQYADKGDNGWWPAVNAIGNRMTDGDFCWTRDWNGVYYLGRIDGACTTCTVMTPITSMFIAFGRASGFVSDCSMRCRVL